MAILKGDHVHRVSTVDEGTTAQSAANNVGISNGQVLDHDTGLACETACEEGSSKTVDGSALTVNSHNACAMVAVHLDGSPGLASEIDITVKNDFGITGASSSSSG